MAAITPQVPSDRSGSFASDVTGMFNFLIDPVAAARCLPRKWFWIAPFVVLSAAAIFYTAVSGPMGLHYAETAPLPANVTQEQYSQQLHIQAAIQKFMPFIMPVLLLIFNLIQSGILLATSSMVAVRARFVELFNLISGCGIISSLQMVAWAVILMLKHEISSPAEIRPPLGLDIFLPEGTNKFLFAGIGYFSVFTVWSLVMMILIYSAGFRVSKAKATFAVLPNYLLGFFFTLLGAAFQKS
jgi:hypothetical protein